MDAKTGEIATPLTARVLENGDVEYTIGPKHTVADICRHLHKEGCAEDAIYILRCIGGE